MDNAACVRFDCEEMDDIPRAGQRAVTVLAGGRVESCNGDEEALHPKTGTVSGVYLLLHEDSRIRSSRIRHAEIFQSIATIGAPDGAHAGSQRIHRAGSRTSSLDSSARLSGGTARFGIGG